MVCQRAKWSWFLAGSRLRLGMWVLSVWLLSVCLPTSLSAALFQNWAAGSWGGFSQGFFFDFHSVAKSRYYQDGDLFYELDDAVEFAGEELIGQDYVFESRTAYYYEYVTVLFIYKYEERLVKSFNALNIEYAEQRKRRTVHVVMPHIYVTYEPLRLGVSYYAEFSEQTAFADEQLWSLRGERAVSAHLQLYVAQIPRTPLGLTALYEFAFDPKATGAIGKEHFQRIGLNMDIYFTHYSQFKLVITYTSSTLPAVVQYRYEEPAADNTDASIAVANVEIDNLARYYLDYVFNYRFTNRVSATIQMGHLLYANFASPAYRFKFGLSYHLGS